MEPFASVLTTFEKVEPKQEIEKDEEEAVVPENYSMLPALENAESQTSDDRQNSKFAQRESQLLIQLVREQMDILDKNYTDYFANENEVCHGDEDDFNTSTSNLLTGKNIGGPFKAPTVARLRIQPFQQNVQYIHFREGLTVTEIVHLLEEDFQGIVDDCSGDDIEVEDIFIAPPPANELTYNDSGDEDTGLLDNLFGIQFEGTG
ncbi:PiggyBac transposable element-derived protein 2, partial [Gryllus bimaculatus]